MSLFRGKVRKVGATDRDVFKLDTPTCHKFTSADAFESALKRQAANTVLLDAREVGLQSIGVDGEIHDTPYRLTKRAFGDLCSFSGVPAGFIRQYAKVNPELALRIIEDTINARFWKGSSKQLVIDVDDGLVHGIVTAERYKPISNLETFQWSMESRPEGFTFTNGWIEGLQARFTSVDDLRPIEPRRGDIVKLGLSVSNGMDGDRSARIQSYAERLVCTNGMVRSDAQGHQTIRHVGDAAFEFQAAIVAVAGRQSAYRELLTAATNTVLTPEQTQVFADTLTSAKGGGKKLVENVMIRAGREAALEGREMLSLTVYNLVNGVTELAHQAKNLDRRVELEQLGFTALQLGLHLAENS